MTVLATVVDSSSLGKVILASFVATVGVTAAFSLAIVGSTRFAELRRDGRVVEAGAFATLAFATLAVCLAAVVEAIVIMTTK